MTATILKNFFYITLCGFSVASLVNTLFLYPLPLEQWIVHNILPVPLRSTFFHNIVMGIVTAWFFAGGIYFFLRCQHQSVKRAHLIFQRGVYRVRPIGLFFLFVFLFHPTIWHTKPNGALFWFPFSCLFLFLFHFWTEASCPKNSFLRKFVKKIISHDSIRMLCFFLMWISIFSYIYFVSKYSIYQHYRLQTSAFDLAIMENTFWNTLQGDWLFSSLEGKSHLGVHTSFIYLLFVPLYALFPYTETLLILQTFFIAFAAFPIYCIANHQLKDPILALFFSGMYLIHPAISGANFYDFHELAFAPFFFACAFYFWLKSASIRFWISIFFLISIKEDLSIIVFLLGIYIFLHHQHKRGILLMCFGIVSYIILQRLIIPYFAGGDHSYSWYYEALIPSGEGPTGLIRTLLINPIYFLEYLCQSGKILFFFQMFAPLAFLCFFDIQNFILISYGLLVSLAASRPYLYQLGFQYPLQIFPYALIGTIMVLAQFPLKKWGVHRPVWIRTMFSLSLLVSYHYGMIYPATHFQGGFRRVPFKYDTTEQDRYEELRKLVSIIPPEASVTASETIAPHVARRKDVQTLRYAPLGKDFYLLFRGEIHQKEFMKTHETVFKQIDYTLIQTTTHFHLYKRNGESVRDSDN